MLVVVALRTAHADDEPLREVLRRAGDYVRTFEADFVSVLTDEIYEQDDYWPRANIHRRRRTRGELLFMRLPGREVSWLSVRNVLEVDGTPVPDSRDRIERAIKGDAAGLDDRMRAVREEGARFNVGSIERNIDDPILPLLFVDPEVRHRFEFMLGGDDRIAGEPVRRVDFREVERPTLIRQNSGDLFTTGSLWIAVDTGVVVRTKIAARTRGTELFSIAVDYRRDSKLEMWIPARMTEIYRQPRNVEIIYCGATYSNARRFETSGRVVR